MSGPRFVVCALEPVIRALAITAAILAFSAGAALAAPPGAVISNQASLDFLNLAGQPATLDSNRVTLTVGVTRSPATVEFTRVLPSGTGSYQEPVGPAACLQGGTFQALGDPQLLRGGSIDPSQVWQVRATAAYNLGEPLFLRLVDSDQNVDYQAVDTVEVEISHPDLGDTETVQLYETGPDTGVFAGYLPTASAAAVAGDCVLQGTLASAVLVSYTDPADAGDSIQSSASLDPPSRVFESRNGTPVSGVQVELVDATTGAPAVVFGNDGVSIFPSQIISGTSVTDSSGTNYVFGPGEYRFPVVDDGDYRIVVTTPSAYVAPSTATSAELQALPGAPYALGPASFGAAFSKSGTEPFEIDLPVDPRASTLFLDKRSLTTTAAPGDFVRYELALENASTAGLASDVTIVDQLPAGMRFVPGSVTIDGAQAPDPNMSADGATLTFTLGTLAEGERSQVFYVVEVVAGRRGAQLVNRATALADGGVRSNEAAVAIRLTEDLFRSTGTIIGRVLEGDCSQETFGEEQGIANVRVYLEDGRYAVTDAGGRFHFEGVEAGTHVAQLDRYSLPEYFDVIGCSATPGFAGSADSQFVKLSQGGLHRADFYLRRKEPPRGRLDIEMRNSGTDSAEQVAYSLMLNGAGNVDIDNIGVMVVLPTGVSYTPGSLRVDGRDAGEPHLRGPALSMALDAQFGNWSTRVEFLATIESHVHGELVTKAVGTFDTPMAQRQKTPIVETRMTREPGIREHDGYVLDLNFAVLSDELSPADRAQLDQLIANWEGVSDVSIAAVGHSDSQRIKAHNQHLFADNYVLSRARALAAATYIGTALEVPLANIQVEGRGPDEPVASNDTADGRRENRRVEMVLTGIRPARPSFIDVVQESSGTKETATVGAVPGLENQQGAPAQQSGIDVNVGMPLSQRPVSPETLQPGYAILHPERGFAPAIPATKIAIQHAPDQSVELSFNGKAVNALTFAGTTSNAVGTVAVSLWEGVNLDDGANELRVVISDADGSIVKRIRRTIHYTGGPIRAELLPEQSTLIADGKTPPVLAVRLYDRSGKPARPGLVGRFRVNAPYRSAWDEAQDRKNSLVEIGERSASYQVSADGVALLELAPTTQTGEVTVVLPFQNYREQELRAWLEPAQRDWILVGFAEGTAAHASLSDNIAAATAAGHEAGYYDEGRVAFFAKGAVKGEFLLTLAWDSARDRATARERFATVVDPNAYYTLYADAAEQRFDAASQRKLYLKIERKQFYALFGDYDTGLSVTELARYERRFNGLKSEYRGRNVGYTVFAAETDQSFHRDELRGDGTSGLYRLGRAPIIAHSEQVRIEVRDRFDNGVVLNSRTLTRFLDYTLDTLDGSLYFKQPVPGRDLDFNPVFIVVEYESVGAGGENVVAGGRASLHFANDAIEVGVSHIDDDSASAPADLTGVDLRWQVNDETLLKAEIATSNAVVGNVAQSAMAHSVSIEHNSGNVDVRAFVRDVEDGFGLGQQSAVERGVRRLGVDARVRLGERFTLEGEAGWQQNLSTDTIRNLVRGQVRYERESFTARLGLAHAEDEYDDGELRTSQLAEFGVARQFLDGKLRLRAETSTAINEDAGNVDYPQRFVIGADYRIIDGVDLVAEYEDADGRELQAQMTRIGLRATPWSRAQLNSFVTSESSEFGPRLFANLGLVQGFKLSERWTLDIGVDRAQTVRDAAVRDFDADRELPSGSRNEDFTAASVGAMYASNLWSANARFESRSADSEDRSTVLFGWYREPLRGHGLSAALTLFTADNVSGNELAQANLRFGWAYRLADRKWAFLNRSDLVFDRAATATVEEQSWRVVNNFSANRRFGAATQLSLQYAFKYVRAEFDAIGYTGYTDLVGMDLRHGFGDRWDAGIATSMLHSYRAGVVDYGIGVDVGYNLGRNIWLSLGYNLAGFEDDDFRAARYTAAGPFLRFSFKADQHLLRSIAGQLR